MFMFGRFTKSAQQVPLYAQKEAARLNHHYIGAEHFLLGLLREGSSVAAQVLHNRGLDLDVARKEVEKVIGKKEHVDKAKNLDFAESAKNAIGFAIEEGFELGDNYVGTEHILLGLLRDKDSVISQVLSNLGVNPEQIRKDLIHQVVASRSSGQQHDCSSCNNVAQTPTLDDYGCDLTRLAREGKLDPLVGREIELERIIQVLSRRTKNNPCLVGEAGVGKTAIVEGLAQRIIQEKVPEVLRDKRVVTLELSALIAGTKYRGEFEERMHNLLQELQNDANTILFIDEVHTIVGAGASEGALDASNVLKPALSRGELQMIGATTLNEYRKYIERDSALERRFQPVMVGEPTTGESLEILKKLRDCYEAHHGVEITDEALEAAVKMGARYIQDRFLPDKAIDLMDEAASRVRMYQNPTIPADLNAIKEIKEKIEHVRKEKELAIQNQDYETAAGLRDEEQQLETKLKSLERDHPLHDHSAVKDSAQDKKDNIQLEPARVTEETIAHVVSTWTGIPVKKLTEEESARLLNLENTLHGRVIGQHEAVTAVSRAIRRGRVGLKDPARPTGSFMFLGPTGVGKTELAKSLAETLFGDEEAIIRLDMSEYMEKHTTSRLVGSPPGYVGYEEGGQLSEKVRRQPYSVILLDEIEKAHPDVFNVLLQVLEDGRLTDGKGRTVDFRNTVVIMTSNVGAEFIQKQPTMGFKTVDADGTYQDMKGRLLEELRRTFRPEFLNRLDDIIVFNTLTEEDLDQIVVLMLEELSERVNELGYALDVTREAKEVLVGEGHDKEYGARPLRRVIQKRLENPLSEEILKGNYAPGDIIEVYAAEDQEGKRNLAFRHKQLACDERIEAMEQSR